jgi:hypothetical protein
MPSKKQKTFHPMSSTLSISYFNHISSDLLLLIFTFLSSNTWFLTCCQVSRAWNRACKSPLLWKYVRLIVSEQIYSDDGYNNHDHDLVIPTRPKLLIGRLDYSLLHSSHTFLQHIKHLRWNVYNSCNCYSCLALRLPVLKTSNDLVNNNNHDADTIYFLELLYGSKTSIESLTVCVNTECRPLNRSTSLLPDLDVFCNLKSLHFEFKFLWSLDAKASSLPLLNGTCYEKAFLPPNHVTTLILSNVGPQMSLWMNGMYFHNGNKSPFAHIECLILQNCDISQFFPASMVKTTWKSLKKLVILGENHGKRTTAMSKFYLADNRAILARKNAFCMAPNVTSLTLVNLFLPDSSQLNLLEARDSLQSLYLINCDVPEPESLFSDWFEPLIKLKTVHFYRNYSSEFPCSIPFAAFQRWEQRKQHVSILADIFPMKFTTTLNYLSCLKQLKAQAIQCLPDVICKQYLYPEAPFFTLQQDPVVFDYTIDDFVYPLQF